jgi:release factor glutamine methyltransferase
MVHTSPAEEFLETITQRLKDEGIEEYRQEGHIIAESVLETDYTKIRAGLAGIPTGVHEEKIEDILSRRRQGEPLAHILGFAHFYGHRFRVASGVLVPRPETEVLVEAAVSAIDSLETENPRILDLYTGCGNILISILIECKRASGLGIDYDSVSLDCAVQNREIPGASGAEFRLSDVIEELGKLEREFNIVTANPPYIAADEVSDLQVEVLRHENYDALVGGHDGLDHIRVLADGVQRILVPGGLLLCEIGYQQEESVAEIYKYWGDVQFIPDLNGIARVLKARP